MTCHALLVLMWPKPSWLSPSVPPGSGGPSRTRRAGALLVDRVQTLTPTRIVLEATGGLARAVTSALATAGLPVVVVHPRQVRDCARATGQLAKTEALDARALAHCADVIRPTPRPLPDAQTQELRALLGRRQPLIGMRTAAQHRLAGSAERLTKNMTAPMTWLNADIATLDESARRCCGPARCGGNTTSGCSVPRAWGPCVPRRCCWNVPSWERARGRRARPWWAWRRSMATVAPCGASARSGGGGACAHRVGHEHTRGDPFQPADQSLLSTTSCSWERQKSGPDRVYASAPTSSTLG